MDPRRRWPRSENYSITTPATYRVQIARKPTNSCICT